MKVSLQDPAAQIAANAMASADPGREAQELLRRARTPSAKPEDQAKAREAAKRLEGVFATLLVKEMRSTHTAGLFGEGTGADVYSGWFDQYLGDVLAKHGELHLAQSIESSIASKGATQP